MWFWFAAWGLLGNEEIGSSLRRFHCWLLPTWLFKLQCRSVGPSVGNHFVFSFFYPDFLTCWTTLARLTNVIKLSSSKMHSKSLSLIVEKLIDFVYDTHMTLQLGYFPFSHFFFLLFSFSFTVRKCKMPRRIFITIQEALSVRHVSVKYWSKYSSQKR